jgi:hypothetical protein
MMTPVPLEARGAAADGLGALDEQGLLHPIRFAVRFSVNTRARSRASSDAMTGSAVTAWRSKNSSSPRDHCCSGIALEMVRARGPAGGDRDGEVERTSPE